MSEECALKKKRECASDCEMVCIKGRVCVSVSESNVKNVVFTGSLPGTAFTQNSHYISFW